MRIGLDAMGGDLAPSEEVLGALEARAILDPDDKVVLIGHRDAIRPHLPADGDWQGWIEIRHTDEAIAMDERPVEALRSKPASSIAVMAQMHRDGEIDACISAGNTGACAAAAQMRLRRLRGVHRPGIAVIAPTIHGPVSVCDVGANVNCRPQHLHQYGVMASIYANALCHIDSPRVALLSIGEEDAKGNSLVKGAHQLMKNDPNLHFIGNIEGRDLFRGACDVLVCEGFVGNVVLKLMEGMAEGIVTSMLGEMAHFLPDQAGAIREATETITRKYDFNEYGGAPLLGVAGIWIICHGASNHYGIMNAIRVAKDYAARQVNQQIVEALSRD